MTSAPSSCMRNTLSAWRSTSTAPMNTMQSRPKSAAAVAVATPCWPAPVSAMRRCLPMRRVSSAWPSTLLILCDPVWVRSSRLSRTRTPSRSERRWHSVTGVGRPAYCVSSSAYSSRNSGDVQALRNSASSSSSAGTSVSGTNRPPNSPNRPRPVGSGPGGPSVTTSPRRGADMHSPVVEGTAMLRASTFRTPRVRRTPSCTVRPRQSAAVRRLRRLRRPTALLG